MRSSTATGAARPAWQALIIRSAYRSPEHNRTVGGAMASKHMAGIAFDIAMANHDQDTIEAAARAVGFGGFGFYPRSGFVFRSARRLVEDRGSANLGELTARA